MASKRVDFTSSDGNRSAPPVAGPEKKRRRWRRLVYQADRFPTLYDHPARLFLRLFNRQAQKLAKQTDAIYEEMLLSAQPESSSPSHAVAVRSMQDTNAMLGNQQRNGQGVTEQMHLLWPKRKYQRLRWHETMVTCWSFFDLVRRCQPDFTTNSNPPAIA